MKKGFVLSTYVYILLVFFLLLLTTMLIVLNNTKVISKKMKNSVLQNTGVESAFNLVLVGDSTVELIMNDEYEDAGVIATTLDGKDISDRVVTASEVNTRIPGVYEVNYRINYNGKTKIIRRNVVVKKDSGYLNSNWITLGNVDSTKVKSITFYNDNRTLGSGVSVAESGKVMLYKVNIEDSDLYDIYIVGNGDVCFPINSSYLFSNTDTSKKFTSLESIDFNNSIDTSFALNMSHMFDECSKLKNIDLSSFDTTNVINMSDMFSNCSSISVLDISNINTSNVVNMNNMFKNDSKLLTIYVGEGISTNSVTTGNDTFLGCSKLIGGYGDVYDELNITSEYAYIGNGGYFTCTEEHVCPISSNLILELYGGVVIPNPSGRYITGATVSLGTPINSDRTFKKWHLVNGDGNLNGNEYVFGNTDAKIKATYEVYNFLSQEWTVLSGFRENVDDGNIENIKSITFYDTRIATAPDLTGITGIDVSEAQDGSILLYKKLDSDNPSMYNIHIVSNDVIGFPENSSDLFSWILDVESINFNNSIDTSNTIIMSKMFMQCNSLTSLDLSSFDTSNVTDMSEMFSICLGLNEINLSSFDTSNVTDMLYMFGGCYSLEELDISNFIINEECDVNAIFGCVDDIHYGEMNVTMTPETEEYINNNYGVCPN